MLVRCDAPLAPLTTLRLGGPAATLVTAYDEDEVVEAVRSAAGPLLVLGGGSNVVLPDDGFPGTVVRVAARGLRVRRDGDAVLVEASAGEDWDALVATTVADGLAGFECLSGIPGLVGGTPVQNVGAYGQDVSQTTVRVRAYDRGTDEVVELTDLGFAYRWSRFKAEPDRWVVLAVTYRLIDDPLGRPVRYPELARALGVDVGAQVPLAEVRAAVLGLRRSKGMVLDSTDPDTCSAGSFFTNPLLEPAQVPAGAPAYPQPDGRVKVSAAWLIEQAGFGKGAFEGPVGISGKHTLALVNRGGGRTADLLRVARAVRDGVRERFDVELVPEPVLVATPWT
ncbi:MAG: UDP-N-acetylmuramate dehydrogenase [Actinobacteria bacterium]|nr:UDP-N-acetylmuramate dehydrogenase [Actinomycetota bacterium]MCA1721383.1 UDP-N-acetylmuramate dehydrogenase [Actinomycetota bacterium]